MLITTSDLISEKKIVKTLGLVRGNSVRAKNIGRDIIARLRNIVGGEIPAYTKLLSESRDVAISRMVEEAENLGADAIVCTRISTASLMQGSSEILAYGTAVKLK